MSTLSRYLLALILAAQLIAACTAQNVQAPPEAPITHDYKKILGKPANNDEVVNLLASYGCVSTNQFQVCKEAGMALWLDSEEMVRKVYLHLNNADGFMPYKDELPFGLKFYDTMGAVEYKLNRQGIGNAGLPEDAAVPDRMHYWAMYKEAGLTIIYNSPFADEDATIYAVVVSS